LADRRTDFTLGQQFAIRRLAMRAQATYKLAVSVSGASAFSRYTAFVQTVF
jgi:hypothetical protein